MIDVRDVGKRYRVFDHPAARLAEWAAPWRVRHRDLWALREVSFQAPPGESLGIVGANGSGKSTLLKILAGALRPTAGEARVDGRVGALLELGMGFHPEFSGRENVMLNGLLLGLMREEILSRMPAILAFSELGEFIDQPLRAYSSGMAVRLGFAVAACLDPRVLLVDEALSVGDAYFQQKCARRMREFQDEGVTILCVSHEAQTIKRLCRKALLLDEGRVANFGACDAVLDHYSALQARRAVQGRQAFTIRRDGAKADAHDSGATHAGNMLAVIERVSLLDSSGQAQSAIVSGAPGVLRIEAVCFADIADPVVGISIRDRLGAEIFGVNTRRMGQTIDLARSGERLRIDFRFDVNLGPGAYTVSAAIHHGDSHHDACFDWVDRALLFEVVPSADFSFLGVARLVPETSIEQQALPRDESDSALAAAFPNAQPHLAAADSEGFLQGWGASDGGRGRALPSEAYFVVRPEAAFLTIDFDLDAAADLAIPEPALALEIVGNDAGQFPATPLASIPAIDGGRHRLTHPLPPDCIGRPVVFRLSILHRDRAEIRIHEIDTRRKP